MYLKKCILISTATQILLFTICISGVEIDSVFFTKIEDQLINDYRLCTGDTAAPRIKDLLKWKSDITSITESELYPSLLKKFTRETGLLPTQVRPCEVIAWQINQQQQNNDAETTYKNHEKLAAQQRDDSLYVIAQYKDKIYRPLDLVTIPFGVTKRCFHLVAKKRGLIFSDEGTYITCDSIMINGLQMKAAFFLDKNGLYYKYELETESAPLDSLDWWIRPLATVLADHFQEKTGAIPDHSYRIGRFDIVQNKLSILKMWNTDDISIYVGLAYYKYRYYAKAIVSSRNGSKNSGKTEN
jgi:hypothetical protein